MPAFKLLRAALLAVLLALPAVAGAQQPGFYVSFSGESSKSSQPITNVYALSASGQTLSTAVLDPGQTYLELRGLVFGPDGKLYVSQAQKSHSAILQFSATTSTGGYTRSFLGQYATPQSSSGLVHPYQPAFGADGQPLRDQPGHQRRDRLLRSGELPARQGHARFAVPAEELSLGHVQSGDLRAGLLGGQEDAEVSLPYPPPRGD
jgi:hypothetical protein